MHEFGICEDVLAAVERRAEGRGVAAVGVRAGALLRIAPEAFEQAFAFVATGSVAEDAATVLEIGEVEGSCRRCDTEVRSLDPVPLCPRCGSANLERTAGDELTLLWVRYRDDAPRTTTANKPFVTVPSDRREG